MGPRGKQGLEEELGLGGLFAEEGKEGGGLVGAEGESFAGCGADDEDGAVAQLAVLFVRFDAGDFFDREVGGGDEAELIPEVTIFESCEGAEPEKNHEDA